MPKLKFPYLIKDTDRHGTVRWYVRKPGCPKVRLKAQFGTPAFMNEYTVAMAGASPMKPSARLRDGSLAWLVARWKESSDWLSFKPSTRRQRDNILTHVLEKSGDVDYRDLTRADIRGGKEDRKDRKGAANNFLKTMNALFRWAEEEELVDENPAAGVRHFKLQRGGFKTWTLDEVKQYRDRWPLGTRERLVFEIAVNTGLRRGDLVRVGWPMVDGDVIGIVTEKTGTHVSLPIMPKLEEALKYGAGFGATWVVQSRGGLPLKKESLGNYFRVWCNKAGIKGKSAHGLRKLCATTAADNGATEMELQALFGWTTNAMSSVYTKQANRRRLALAGALKMILAEGPEDEDEGAENVIPLRGEMGRKMNADSPTFRKTAKAAKITQ